MSRLLNLVYLALLVLASPALLYRMLALGKYRDGWGQKLLGRLPRRTGDAPCVWFHAVSVGEVLQLETVVGELLRRRPGLDIVVTTTTVTGMAVARERFPQHLVCYFPLDFSWSVKAALNRIQPDAVVLVELELWPNFICEVHRREIPLVLINGRISEKSFRGYRRIRPLMKRVLSCFDAFAVQNATYADRLRELGAPAERIQTTGSIKFDRVQVDRDNPQTRELRRAFGLKSHETVFLAGSTHAPEESIAIDVWWRLQEEFPHLRLLLVPRHKERFDEVARLAASRGFPVLRRSSGSVQRRTDAKPEVLLLDTLGELSACWGLADVAFVGGSMMKRGGQNMIEPAAYGAAVLFGPNTRNFRDVVEMLLDGDAAMVVNDADELAATLRRILNHRELAANLGRRARELVLSQQGATVRTINEIEARLPADNPPAVSLTAA